MKKSLKYLFLLTFILKVNLTFSQDYKSVTYQNYLKAKDIFDKLQLKNKYNLIDTFYYSLIGTWEYLGHFSLPEKREPAKVSEKVYMQGNNLKLNGILELSGDKYYKQFSYYDSLSLLNYGEQDAITNFNNIREQEDIPLLSPITLINDINKNIKSLRYIGYSKKDTADILTYSSYLGNQISIYVRADSIILKAETLDYDNMNGDYLNEYLYQNYTIFKNFLLPTKLIIKEWNVVKKAFNYEYQTLTKKEILSHQYKIEKLDSQFYSILLPNGENRVYVIDFGKYLGIIEAPVSNEYSLNIYQNLQTEFPKKEIKYLFFTHHHPDHAGGFDYFYKQGLTIVTTNKSKEYFEGLSKRNHTIKNDFKLINKKGNFEIVTSNGEKKIETEIQSVYIYEFGKGSKHTEEYLIYYLPKQKSIVIGDLWCSPLDGNFGSERANNIYNFIQEKSLDVKYIYQTWPLTNMQKVARLEDLKESVKLYLKE